MLPPHREVRMATITKKELIDRIAEGPGGRRVQVKRIVQQFLDEVVNELGKGNRLEFRDFGVFETKLRKARKAQNPKTLEPVEVPEKRTVKFKVGRLMKQRLAELTGVAIDDEAGDIRSEEHTSELQSRLHLVCRLLLEKKKKKKKQRRRDKKKKTKKYKKNKRNKRQNEK